MFSQESGRDSLSVRKIGIRAGWFCAAGGLLCLFLTLGMSPGAAAEPPVKTPAEHAGGSSAQPAAQPASQSDSAPWPSTEVWKTFSQGWNYTIKYPSTAEIVSDDPADLTIEFVQWYADTVDGRRQTTDLLFGVWADGKPENLSLKQWVLKYAPEHSEYEKKWVLELTRKHLDPPFEDITVAGRPAYRVKIPHGRTEWYHIYVADGKKVYILLFEDPQNFKYLPMEVRNHYSEVFQQMLESFSFGGH